MQSINYQLEYGVFTLITSSTAFVAYHKSGSKVIYVSSKTEPTSFDSNTAVIGASSQGAVIERSGLYDTSVYAYAINSTASIDVTPLVSVGDSTFVNADLPGTHIRTVAATELDTLNSIGVNFSFKNNYLLSSGQTIYIAAQFPSDGVLCGLRNRYIKGVDGEIEIAVNQGITTDPATGSLISNLTENRYKNKASATKFYDLGVVEPSGGVWAEVDITSTSGSGSNTSGAPLPSDSFRIYNLNDRASLRITNNQNSDNRVIVGYSWVEFPTY